MFKMTVHAIYLYQVNVCSKYLVTSMCIFRNVSNFTNIIITILTKFQNVLYNTYCTYIKFFCGKCVNAFTNYCVYTLCSLVAYFPPTVSIICSLYVSCMKLIEFYAFNELVE